MELFYPSKEEFERLENLPILKQTFSKKEGKISSFNNTPLFHGSYVVNYHFWIKYDHPEPNQRRIDAIYTITSDELRKIRELEGENLDKRARKLIGKRVEVYLENRFSEPRDKNKSRIIGTKIYIDS